MLEASGFDFRTRHPQKTLIKLARHYGLTSQSQVSNVAYRISQDLYRTFAPIKQTASTMAFTCLELAGRLLDQRIEAVELGVDYEKWRTSREEVMGKCSSQIRLYWSTYLSYQKPSLTYWSCIPTVVAPPQSALISQRIDSSQFVSH